MRGAGRLFGPDITESVLRRLDVDVLFRSHEPRKAMAGPAFDHEGRVVTLSSTGVYGGRPFLVLLEEEDFEMGMSRELVEGAVRFLDG